jgi:hypothetical protein
LTNACLVIDDPAERLKHVYLATNDLLTNFRGISATDIEEFFRRHGLSSIGSYDTEVRQELGVKDGHPIGVGHLESRVGGRQCNLRTP